MATIAFYGVEAWEKDWLVTNLGGRHQATYSPLPLDYQALTERTGVHAVCVGPESSLIDRVLRYFPDLELVVVRAKETDKVDMAACRHRRITVCNAPETRAASAAEYTFALMLALARRLPEAFDRARSADDVPDGGLRGMDLCGKTLGVIGTGNVGARVIAIAKGLGMKVLAANRRHNVQLASEVGFPYVPREMVLSQADVLTLHIPYVAPGERGSTHHFMGEAEFSLMKRGALLINTAHEALCDAGALRGAISAGRLGGAAFDAVDPTFAKLFAGDPRVIVTPRLASDTKDARARGLAAAVDALSGYFRGFPQHVVGEGVGRK